jgi:hypothetical protein
MTPLRSTLHGRASLCGAAPIAVGGREFHADAWRAYIECTFAHSLPVVNELGQAMLPGVLARSWASVQGGWVNEAHLMRAHDAQNLGHDHTLGFVAAAELETPNAERGTENGETGKENGDNLIPEEKENAPHIRAALCLWKHAAGAQEMLEKPARRSLPLAVSMEIFFTLPKTAFAWRVPAGAPLLEGGRDLGSGWHGLEWSSAPDDLKRTLNAAGAVRSRWRGREVVLLLGGWEWSVDFLGVGLVDYPMEKEAEVLRLLAGRSAGDVLVDEAVESFTRANAALEKI